MKTTKILLLKISFLFILLPQAICRGDCLDDYGQRKDQLKRQASLGFAKNTAIATGVTGAVTLGFGYLFWSPGPLAGISYAVGAIGAGVPAFTTILAIEATTLTNLKKTNTILKIIRQSYLMPEKAFNNFVNRIEKKLGRTVDPQAVADWVKLSNENGALCDTSLVSRRKKQRFQRKGKLKFRLASKKEMIKGFIARESALL